MDHEPLHIWRNGLNSRNNKTPRPLSNGKTVKKMSAGLPAKPANIFGKLAILTTYIQNIISMVLFVNA